MRIDFESSGGLANLSLNYHTDTDTLPQEKADELKKLVKTSGFLDIQQNDIKSKGASGPPDVISYQLSIAEENKKKTLSFNDVTAPASLRPLLESLQKLAIDQKRKG
jgi:hypothetical protein